MSDLRHPPGIAFTPPVEFSLSTLLTHGGADGAVLDAVTVDGDLFAYDPVGNTVTSASTAAWNYVARTHALYIPRPNGAQVVVVFDTGTLVSSGPQIGVTEVIDVRFVDGDGDRVTTTLTIDPVSALPPLVRRDRVRTNVVGNGASFAIPAEFLLANEEAAAALAVTGVNSASDGTASLTGGNAVFVDNDADGGSFVYVAEAAGRTSSARVSVPMGSLAPPGLRRWSTVAKRGTRGSTARGLARCSSGARPARP